MARGEREVKVTVLGDSKGGQRALSELDDKATKTGNHFDGLGGKLAGFGKMAAIGLGGAAVAAGGFLAKAVSSASDLGETLSKVGVVFGEAKDQVVADADFMAKSFGIPKQAFLDASASIGLIGKASGLAKAEVGPFSTGLARLATDASSFFNVPLEEALMAIQSGLTGEAEPLRRFGVLLNEAAVEDEALRLGLIKTGEEMTDGIKVQARASLITKGLADANGDLERTQGSLSNRLRELKGRAENFAASLGEKAIPFVLKLMDAGENLGKKLGPAFSYIAEVAGFIGPAFMSAFSGEGVTSDGIVGVAERVGVALRAIVDWVKKNWPEIKKIITETLKTVQQVIKGVVDVITTIWENFGDQITAVVKAAWTFVKSTIEAALKTIQGIVKVVTSLIHGDWSGVWEGIKMVLAGAWDFIMARIRFAIEVVKAVLSTALEIIGAVWSGAWNGIKDFFAGIWDSVFQVARNGVARIVDTFLGMAGSLIGIAEKAFGWMPIIGDDIRRAARAFEEFRDRTNAALRGTDSEKTINVYHNNYHRDYYETVRGMDPWVGSMHTGGIVPGSGDVPMILEGGEGVFTPEQMAVLGRSMGGRAGGDGASAGGMYVVVNVAGSVVTERELVEAVQAGLLQKQRRVPSLGLT